MPRIHPVETTTQQRIEISEATVSNKGARVEESPETTSAKAPTMLQQLCRTVNSWRHSSTKRPRLAEDTKGSAQKIKLIKLQLPPQLSSLQRLIQRIETQDTQTTDHPRSGHKRGRQRLELDR
ncbi:hypothetical protein YC2023_020194 [Brassica napus]